MPLQATKTEFRKYRKGAVSVESNCIQITFVNSGQANLTINNLLLTPNDYLTISQDSGYIDTTVYKLNFVTDPYADANDLYELTVIRIQKA